MRVGDLVRAIRLDEERDPVVDIDGYLWIVERLPDELQGSIFVRCRSIATGAIYPFMPDELEETDAPIADA